MLELKKRILDISYQLKLSHIGSCLNSVEAIENCYKNMVDGDMFVLSSGHAFLALAVVLEKYKGMDAVDLVKRHGTHPERNVSDQIWVSTGSLGQGLPIAVGMAMANKNNNVYVVLSDGETNEGSVWESLRIAGEQRLENLRVTVVANGYSALGRMDVDLLDERLQLFYPTLVWKSNLFEFPEWLQGLEAHYHVMSDEDYEEVKKIYE